MAWVKTLLITLLVMMGSLTGCISDLIPFGGVHVGTFQTERLGIGTAEVDDMIIELELLNSSSPIKYNDGTTTQDGGEYYRFLIAVGETGDDTRPTYECRLSTDSPDDCLIIESVEDGVWEIGEIITLQENSDGSGVCDSGCRITLTIMNGDIDTEAEEDLQYVASKSIGGPISHTYNFWTHQ